MTTIMRIGIDSLGTVLDAATTAQQPTSTKEDTRSKIEDIIKLDTFLFWGSMVPFIGPSFSAVRIVYGGIVIAFAAAEIINNISIKAIGSKDEPAGFDLWKDVKKGAAALPTLLYGFQQLAGGFLVNSSIIGKISTIVWETIIRPNTKHSIFMTTPTIDLNACGALWNRLKDHSAVNSIRKAWSELIARALNQPVASKTPTTTPTKSR